MKRSLALVLAGGLTTILGIFVLFAILSTFATPTAANQSVEPIVSDIVSEPPQVDMAATDMAQAQYEAAIKERESALQNQVSQLEQAIIQLDADSQAEIARLNAQIDGIKIQTKQSMINIETMQDHAASLQQAVQTDGETYQNEMAKMADAETQFRQQIDTLNAQLNGAYNQLAQRQAEAAAAAAAAVSNGGGGHDDDDDDHHERDHDDDDDDHHERDHDDDHEDDDDD